MGGGLFLPPSRRSLILTLTVSLPIILVAVAPDAIISPSGNATTNSSSRAAEALVLGGCSWCACAILYLPLFVASCSAACTCLLVSFGASVLTVWMPVAAWLSLRNDDDAVSVLAVFSPALLALGAALAVLLPSVPRHAAGHARI